MAFTIHTFFLKKRSSKRCTKCHESTFSKHPCSIYFKPVFPYTPGPTSQRHGPTPVPRPRCAPNNNSRIMEHGRRGAVSSMDSKTKARKRRKPWRVAQRARALLQADQSPSSARFPPSSARTVHTPTPPCRFTGGEAPPCPSAFFLYCGPVLAAAGGERSGAFLRGRSAVLRFRREWRGEWKRRGVAIFADCC